MRKTITLALLTLSINGFAEDWVPEVKFQLESAQYIETLNWVSGVSYTLSKYQSLSKQQDVFCNALSPIGSKELLHYLNFAHAGKTITSEQATDTIFTALQKAYPCR
jgi:hypothetical protein